MDSAIPRPFDRRRAVQVKRVDKEWKEKLRIPGLVHTSRSAIGEMSLCLMVDCCQTAFQSVVRFAVARRRFSRSLTDIRLLPFSLLRLLDST